MLKKCFFIAMTYFAVLSTLPSAFASQGAPISGCTDQREFLVEGKSVPLCWLGNRGAWVSPACVKKSKVACGAVKLAINAKKMQTRLSPDDLKGGKNPGSVLCAKSGGVVRMATLPTGSQITFCEAKDHSLIDCSGLANSVQSSI